jgi:hypothetical protein
LKKGDKRGIFVPYLFLFQTVPFGVSSRAMPNYPV